MIAPTMQAVDAYIVERLPGATAVQTVGAKQWDGFLLAIVNG